MSKKEQIIYYPVFDDSKELSSHYYRACWYFPSKKNHCEQVVFFKTGCYELEKPDYMGSSNVDIDHIVIREKDEEEYKNELEQSRVVLVWKKESVDELDYLKTTGTVVINVDTMDPTAIEYGRYCGIIWKYFLRKEERIDIIQQSHQRFLNAADEVRKMNYSCGCVFGTGPSLETAYEYNFDSCLSVVCNSIVQNKDLLNHIKPKFITAGDVVSHLGVSAYAEKFRSDLVVAMKEFNLYYLTTATFGYLLMIQCEEIADRIILVEQLLDVQNFDLCNNFALPKLDSTFNIHMLPIINTFCNDIYILGCDGKSKVRSNEDFWAHAQKAQYDSLVDTGHQCHPTFDINRQKSTYDRYLKSVQLSVDMGEQTYNKKYYTLNQSNIDALENKRITDKMHHSYDLNGRLEVAKLSG